jgi:acetolactate synthase-1/3 small subunit
LQVACQSDQRRELESIASIFHGSIVDVSPTSMVIQVEGKERKMKALQDVLQQYGILEIARTGRVALLRQSGVDSNYLNRFQQGRIM